MTNAKVDAFHIQTIEVSWCNVLGGRVDDWISSEAFRQKEDYLESERRQVPMRRTM